MQFTRPFLSLEKVGLACESSMRLAYYLLLHLQKYLTFLECDNFTKGISSALSAISNILHSSGTQFVYRSLSYIVVANLGSWERGYVNCNSTYLVKTSTLSGMRLAASKTAARSWISRQSHLLVCFQVQGLNSTHSRMRSLPAGTAQRRSPKSAETKSKKGCVR